MQGNVWAIHHNEREFPEPDRFIPERFIKGSEWNRPFPAERGYMTFGWGRRVCSGQGLAEQGTFITIARLLWGFRIEKALDENGKEIPVDIFDFTYVPTFSSVFLYMLQTFELTFGQKRSKLAPIAVQMPHHPGQSRDQGNY